MQSRQNGQFKRTVLSALAAMVAAAVPSFVSSNALAEPPPGNKGKASDATADAPAHDASNKASAKHETKKHEAKKPEAKKPEAKKVAKHEKNETKHLAKKAQAPKAAKLHAKQEAKHEAPAKPPEAQGDAKPKAAQAPAKAKKATKKTASRAPAGKKKATPKKADTDAPKKPCLGAQVTIDRGGLEGQSLPLLDCKKKPLEAAQRALSALARPWGAAKPDLAASKDERAQGKQVKRDKHGKPPAKPGAHHDPGELAPGVRMVDKGLLSRIDAVARHFPGRPISLVSGYRPQSRGSLHQSARALDLRVAGVSNEDLVAFCKTLPDTGCGYYPNSSFVHLDVRNPGTGSVTWIDASGPGEAPRYVQRWPLPEEHDAVAATPPDGDRHDDADDPWAEDPADDAAAKRDTAKKDEAPAERPKPASPAANAPAKPQA